MWSSWFEQQNTTNITPIEEMRCGLYRMNDTVRFIKEYEGIPENLIINVIAWAAMIVLFTFLRFFEDFGKFGLIKSTEEESENLQPTKQYRIWNSFFYTPSSSRATTQTIHNDLSERYFLSWLVNIFRLKDEHILEKSGKDALYYIMFQRYLIIYLVIATLTCVGLILPINMTGKIISDKAVFGSTTIVNLDPSSNNLWFHLIVSWIFLILMFLMMRQLSNRMRYTEHELVTRTILIIDIPRDKCHTNILQDYFRENYKDLKVTEIQFAYKTNKMSNLSKKRRAMHAGREQSEKYLQETGIRPRMYPFHFGSLFELCCCCCSGLFKTVDAIDYYTERETFYSNQLADATNLSFNMPLGIAFVTFEDEHMASAFYNMRRKCMCLRPATQHDPLSLSLRDSSWTVKKAPSPSDIKWTNLQGKKWKWWLRWFLINFFIMILLIFFTTPTILITSFSDWNHIFIKFDYIKVIKNMLPQSLVEFLPSLLLRLFSALLPVVVSYTALIEKYWTRSSENYAAMIKTFVLLLFMVLILPTVGITSINKFIYNFLKNTEIIGYYGWKCIPENGAFFVKYVTTSCFIGTALDILRLPELLVYIIKLLWSRSISERQAVKLNALYEFEYGFQYAWILTVFTVTISFSVVCPIIVPFGLVYMFLKHLVDRYNIYFAYVYTKVDEKIHKTALNFAIASVILLQVSVMFFIYIRKQKDANDVMTVIQFFIVLISLFFVFGRLWFGLFKRLSLFTLDTKPGFEEITTAPISLANNEDVILENREDRDKNGDDSQLEQSELETIETLPPREFNESQRNQRAKEPDLIDLNEKSTSINR